MLSVLALGMLAVFMLLVVSGRASPLTALILVPVAFGLAGGFGATLGPMMLQGVEQLAPTGAMLCFAILYFCIMSDAGLFDPLIRAIVRVVRRDPVRIVIGTAVLALLISVDGDGSTTYIICCSAMMPIYRRIGLNPQILACLLMLACGITNILPWGGPTAVVASALLLDPAEVFVPLVPGMLVAALFVVLVAYWLGRGERRRLAGRGTQPQGALSLDSRPMYELSVEQQALRRPRLFAVNLIMTIVLLVALVMGLLPLPVLFMIAASIALLLNYPSLNEQKERLAAHADNILRVISVIFAAGVFVGILNGTGMAEALARQLVAFIPERWGIYMAPITGLLSMPLGFVMSNKAFFFGVVPVLSEAAAHYGVASVDIARAALIGQAVHVLSPTVPSTYLLVALAQVEFGAHQRFTIKWAVLVALIVLAVTVLTGGIAIVAS